MIEGHIPAHRDPITVDSNSEILFRVEGEWDNVGHYE